MECNYTAVNNITNNSKLLTLAEQCPQHLNSNKLRSCNNIQPIFNPPFQYMSDFYGTNFHCEPIMCSKLSYPQYSKMVAPSIIKKYCIAEDYSRGNFRASPNLTQMDELYESANDYVYHAEPQIYTANKQLKTNPLIINDPTLINLGSSIDNRVVDCHKNHTEYYLEPCEFMCGAFQNQLNENSIDTMSPVYDYHKALPAQENSYSNISSDIIENNVSREIQELFHNSTVVNDVLIEQNSPFEIDLGDPLHLFFPSENKNTEMTDGQSSNNVQGPDNLDATFVSQRNNYSPQSNESDYDWFQIIEALKSEERTHDCKSCNKNLPSNCESPKSLSSAGSNLPCKKDSNLPSGQDREILKAAKIMYSKRTQTLLHWLNPSISITKLKTSIHLSWDSLPSWEKELYISQVMGKLGSNQFCPLINPQLSVVNENLKTKDNIPIESEPIKRKYPQDQSQKMNKKAKQHDGLHTVNSDKKKRMPRSNKNSKNAGCKMRTFLSGDQSNPIEADNNEDFSESDGWNHQKFDDVLFSELGF